MLSKKCPEGNSDMVLIIQSKTDVYILSLDEHS